MASKAARLYDDTPSIGQDDAGKPTVVRPSDTQQAAQVDEGEETVNPAEIHARHQAEIAEMHKRHQTDQKAIHKRHEEELGAKK